MDSNNSDWRLQGQENLFGKTLVHKSIPTKQQLTTTIVIFAQTNFQQLFLTA
jgi:hypothetical protein